MKGFTTMRTKLSVLDKIKKCKKCNLCKNQKPLLDNHFAADIMWVGLSAKLVNDVDTDIPLAIDTNSGKLISAIEANCDGFTFYKTNLVKCLPVDVNDKLRYPTKKEIDLCIGNLMMEIDDIQPKIVFLLGNKVSKAVESKLGLKFSGLNEYNYKIYEKDGTVYVPVHHPSYISVYKRKFCVQYYSGIKNVIIGNAINNCTIQNLFN
jgi:DNA polymerase